MSPEICVGAETRVYSFNIYSYSWWALLPLMCHIVEFPVPILEQNTVISDFSL